MVRMTRALILLLLSSSLHAESITLAKEGRALVPIVVSEQTQSIGTELAGMLKRITGAEFTIEISTEPHGIYLGLNTASHAITEREDYSIRSEKDRLVFIGNSPQAVEHAVWDLLHQMGFRQFFPGKTWEVVPQQPTLSIDVNVTESPDYHVRKIWAGFAYLKERNGVYDEWCRRNRATSGITLSSGHAYDGIMKRHETEFAQHPEFLGLVKGERKGNKFCISNADLRKLVVADALAEFAKDPSRDSLSCEPSDGGGWCECAECAKIGSVTDRALLLANEVAEAVNAKHPGRIIGMYAYNEHSPPPSIEAHPQVVIGIATGFIRGGYTMDQLLAGWQAKAKTLGIREYYSVNTWDRDLPGAARGGNLEYLRTTIPHFHDSGARFMSAEASDNFGPNGLGYYLAARMLWDVREAKNVEALIADFLDKSFGSAKAPMTKFYALLDGTKRQALSDDLLGRMFRLLDEARALTSDASIRARLDDLSLYTRYVELYHDYASAQGKERQAAFEQLFRFIWRPRHTGMVHVKALWRDLPNRDKSVALPALAKYSDPDATNPWKSDEVFTADQIAGFIRDGIANRKLLDFEPVAFSSKLVPATALKLGQVPKGNAGIYLRGVRDFWTWIDKEPATIKLTGKAGIIYPTRGNAKVDLYPLAEAESKAVAHFEIPPDKAEHAIELKTAFSGLHRIEVSDGAQGTLIAWPDGLTMTVVSSQEQPAKLYGRWHLYFYVPKGTKIIGGFSEGEGFLLDPAGKTVHTFADKPGYFSIPVPAGEDGKLWSFKHSAGNRFLMTVPPCLARDASELLLPEEVVTKDLK
jgi:hypothetical protein